MVHTNGIRVPEQRPTKLRASISKYSTRCLASSSGLSAASFAIPTSGDGGASGKSMAGQSLYSPFIRHLSRQLEHDSSVALAAGDALAVQELEQRNRVFAGDSGPVFEFGHSEAMTLMDGKQVAQTLDG